VCAYLVGSVADKFTSASYELFPVCHDDHNAYLRHRAWPSHQNEDDTRVSMYCQNQKCVLVVVCNLIVIFFSGIHLNFA